MRRCEAGYTAPDPLHPEILFGGTVTRCNVETGKIENVSPEVDLPTPARHTWTVPLVFSPADPRALYFSDHICSRPPTAAATGRASART